MYAGIPSSFYNYSASLGYSIIDHYSSSKTSSGSSSIISMVANSGISPAGLGGHFGGSIYGRSSGGGGAILSLDLINLGGRNIGA